MMTEEEAKTKWCPMVHFRFMGAITYQENTARAIEMKESEDRKSLCIASDCALWQWKLNTSPGKNRKEIIASYSTTEGYCGLGGKL